MPTKNRTTVKPKRWATPVTNYLKAQSFAKDRLWSYSPEKGLTTIVDGRELTGAEFDREYPHNTPTHFYNNPENPNIKNNFGWNS